VKRFLVNEFSGIGKRLYRRLKKFQSKFVQPLEFGEFCDAVEKLMNQPRE